jgi:hypothetical protein
MKKSLQLFIGVMLTLQLPAQNFTGQWKGEFVDNSTSFVGWGGDRCDYVLELECTGQKVSGYSYTYFSDAGKRYYTICRLVGKINKATKSIEVTEVERTKTNVPNNIRNCFQIHKLTYSKDGDEQMLEGTWAPAPDQEGDCGYGTTSLTRRVLQKNTALFDNSTTKVNKPVTKPNKPVAKPDRPVTKVDKPVAKPDKPVAKADKPVAKITRPVSKPPVQATPLVKDKVPNQVITNSIPKPMPPPVIVKTDPIVDEKTNTGSRAIINQDLPERRTTDYEKRTADLLKTIEIDNESFRVDLYDNGEIDGDSISLFYNGRLLLSHKRLSDKAITLTLNVENKNDVNELVMYAENLGEIPPNTALMVVTDGDSRYEVRISSDLQQSGVIRFIHKAKAGQ